ncbi:peptide ABC transporter substrate-binding protein [Paenibacillus athensensis]|uniref:Solute-binding protein family 5 domain-containing protein n=1 Tax=Paenibacillus athensensis TaxID=1967502 RepID=A0A4Y8PRV3_9BACL|nr:peptide ABC transporter substrate-binding protein [Paenibacillus athensensis]MCD1261518.1 peptide ABC transporter substrate-binding protein [Paenibacillus athensensis]
MNKIKALAACIASLLGAGGLAGCSAPQETMLAAAARAPDIRINLSGEPPILDSSKTTSNAAFTLINAFHEGLYRTRRDGQVVPGLAEALPQVSADGLVYTMSIRPHAVWADGRPVTADDFVYAFRRTLDPATRAPYSFMVGWIAGGRAVTEAGSPAAVRAAQEQLGARALDERRLEIRLERPVPFFTQLLAFPVFFPQRRDVVEREGAMYGAEARAVLGAGPYTLAEWKHGQSLALVKNPRYWDAASVHIPRATLHIVKDIHTALNLYETGHADLTEVNGDQLQLYAGKPDRAVKQELTTGYLLYQTQRVPALSSAKIRRALGMAIDRAALTQTALAGSAAPAAGLVPVGTLDGAGGEFRRTAGDTQPPFDPAAARLLLAEGLRELGLAGLPRLTVIADDSESAKKSLEFILAQWKQHLGYEAEAAPLPHALRIERCVRHDFQIALALWGADYNDPQSFLDLWTSGGQFNEGDFSNPRYDALLAAAGRELSLARRAEQLAEAERLLMEEQAVSPLYYRKRAFLKKPAAAELALPPFGMDWELKGGL